jgi:hypothetical protein
MELAEPARDLFDERAPAPVVHVGAIAPMTIGTDDDRRYLALRWWAAGRAVAVAGGAALLVQLPQWAVAAVALFAGGMSLWPLPRWAARAWLVVAASFLLAQVTSIFVNQPFTWPLRFVFFAALLGSFAALRGSE